MSDQQYFNPFDADNLIRGGGLWDGKVVTVVSAKALTEKWTHKDGTPVQSYKNPEEQATQNVLQIIGVAEDSDRERPETYSAGSLIPTADGEGFTKADGSFTGINEKSALGKFVEYLKTTGFPVINLWDEKTNKSKLSGLVGARFVMKGEPKLDKNGNIKKNTKGYDELSFWPVKFVGFKEGVGGSKPKVDDKLEAEAIAAFTEVLAEAGGQLGKAELVRKLSAKFAGNRTLGSKVLTLVTKEEFHQGKPWTKTDTGYTL